VDPETLAAYERNAALYADEWQTQPAPVDLYGLVDRYFLPGRTADVGAGTGRDAAWLMARGFPVVAFEPSAALIREGRRRHPQVEFRQAALPDLPGEAPGSFRNVLAETVIMHLPPELVGLSVARLWELVGDGGTLYLSWRVTDGEPVRDAAGRLYAAFCASLVRGALPNATLLVDETVISASSGRRIHRLVARKP
jgi:SAM-dependent methyltransferase